MNLGFDNTGFTKVSELTIPANFFNRMKTDSDMDLIFGEGILPGSATTVTAVAGGGKTTFMLELLERLTTKGYRAGYASGEESVHMLAYTCKRLNVTNVSVANETDIDKLADAMEYLDVLVVDSFPSLTTSTKMNSREREEYAITTLTKKAKDTDCAIFFIMHLTKTGVLKGSTLVPHTVDVNIKIERDDSSEDDTVRIFNTYKNRFGATGEIEANLTATGYDMIGKREKPLSEKERLEKSILEMDPPAITEDAVMNAFNISKNKAYVALKELVNKNKLIKFGRGKSAVWKKVEVSVEKEHSPFKISMY